MTDIDSTKAFLERLPAYVDGTLVSEERVAMENHLRVSRQSRVHLDEFIEVQELMSAAFPLPSKVQKGGVPGMVAATPMDWTSEEEVEIEAPGTGFLDSLQERMGAAPWWVISGAFHALLILLLTLISYAILRADTDRTVIITDLARQEKPPEQEKPKVRDILEKIVPIQTDEVVTEQTPIVTHEELEVADHVETDNDSDAEDAIGENGVSDVFLGGNGTVAAMGLGGGGRAGAFGRPSGRGGRLRRAVGGGGGKDTESAVDKGLEWLARNQEADGHWDIPKHGGTNCETAITGMALLAFLGAGHTEKVGKYRDNVRRAVKWIIEGQNDAGRIYRKDKGNVGYNHAMAGMALSEAAAMARIPATMEAAKKAIRYSVEDHLAGEGSEKKGYRYRAKQNPADISNHGWYVMHLKSSIVAGLHVPHGGKEGAIWFLDQVEAKGAKKDGDDTYDNGRHRYGYSNPQSVTHRRTAIGCLNRLFLGWKPEEIRGGVQWFVKKGGVPSQKKCDLYYWYYGTLCTFQMGQDIWKEWNEGLKGALLPTQRRGGDEDGSWDPSGACSKHWGRVGQTAMSVLCLEVYYRYLPMYRE